MFSPTENQSDSAKKEIRVAAAADLYFVMNPLSKEFQTLYPHVSLVSTLDSAGNLLTRIQNGEPFDLLLSGETSQIELLKKGGKIIGHFFYYGIGHLVLWTLNRTHVDLSQGLMSLTSPKIKKIALAYPQKDHYGKAALEALIRVNLYESVTQKLVYGENVAQIAQWIQSGSVEIGMIALSLAKASELKALGHFSPILDSLYPPLIQSGGILKTCTHLNETSAFRDFLVGPRGIQILSQFGLRYPIKPNENPLNRERH